MSVKEKVVKLLRLAEQNTQVHEMQAAVRRAAALIEQLHDAPTKSSPKRPPKPRRRPSRKQPEPGWGHDWGGTAGEEHFAGRYWRRSAAGNAVTDVNGLNVVVFVAAYGTPGFSYGIEGGFTRLRWRTEHEAMRAAVEHAQEYGAKSDNIDDLDI